MADQLIAARYRVIRELGRGGMGVVYVVEHVHTGDQLALKLLHGQSARNADVIERFKREARASARIKSEHIVKVVDADVAPELEGAPFLVMELLNGIDLDKQLETQGRMPPEQAVHYLAQAARALDKSHQMGIVHRDLKPENLFIHHREDGSTVLKILDFGISKIITGEGSNDIAGARMTSTGTIMGTPLYMSPEQARGLSSEIAPTTDVWAMGLIALQMITGEVYWRANTIAELMAQILSEPLYAPSQRWTTMPPAIDAWFARSCARDPKGRFPSVGLQVQTLAAALGVRASAASAPESAAVPPSPPADSTRSTPLVGARSTRGALVREPTEARASRATWIAGFAVLLLGGAGATAWTTLPHGNAASAVASLSASSSSSSLAPAASAEAPASSATPPAPLASSGASAPSSVPPAPSLPAPTPMAAVTPHAQSHPQTTPHHAAAPPMPHETAATPPPAVPAPRAGLFSPAAP